MQSLKPLVHLIGFQATHSTIMQITLEASQATAKNYKNYNVVSEEFYDAQTQQQYQPLIYRDSSKGDRVKPGPTDLGFMKQSFFKALVTFKPAVTILVFDWQNQSESGIDWKTYEAQVLAEVKQHQDRCPGSRQSKMILLIFLPLND